MTYKDLVDNAMDRNNKAIKELNSQGESLTSEQVNALILSNLVTMISTLALCVASIADDINEIKRQRR